MHSNSGAENFHSELACSRLAFLFLIILISDLRTYICPNMVHASSAQTQSSGINISSIHSLALNRAAVVLPNSIMIIGSCMRVTSYFYLSTILIVFHMNQDMTYWLSVTFPKDTIDVTSEHSKVLYSFIRVYFLILRSKEGNKKLGRLIIIGLNLQFRIDKPIERWKILFTSVVRIFILRQ